MGGEDKIKGSGLSAGTLSRSGGSRLPSYTCRWRSGGGSSFDEVPGGGARGALDAMNGFCENEFNEAGRKKSKSLFS